MRPRDGPLNRGTRGHRNLVGPGRLSFQSTWSTPMADGRSVSATAGAPCCDFLDEPRIAVGITEGEERRVTRALGVGAGEPCLHRERRAVPHVTHVDATALEFVMSRFDVGDIQRGRGGARRGRTDSVAQGDRASRAGGCELDNANALCRGDILVEPPTEALVELLR